MARMIVQREVFAACAACAGDMCCGVCMLTVQTCHGWWQVSQVQAPQEMAGKGAAYPGQLVTGVHPVVAMECVPEVVAHQYRHCLAVRDRRPELLLKTSYSECHPVHRTMLLGR